MLNLPGKIIELFNPFAPVFHGETTWEKAKEWVVGTILTPGKRTVSAALRVGELQPPTAKSYQIQSTYPIL